MKRRKHAEPAGAAGVPAEPLVHDQEAAPAAPETVGRPPEAAAASPSPPPPPPAAAQAAAANSEQALKDRLLRLQADFDNFRKRTLKERGEIVRLANADLMLELLPVLDHARLGLKAAEEHGADKSFCQGFRQVADQLDGVLRKFGLAEVQTEGCRFNPAEHEAVSALPSAEVPEGVVLVQTRTGYRLGDRVLRAAQVVVSGGPPGGPAAGRPASDAGQASRGP